MLVLCLLAVQLVVLEAQFFAQTPSMKVVPRVRRTQQRTFRDEVSEAVQ